MSEKWSSIYGCMNVNQDNIIHQIDLFIFGYRSQHKQTFKTARQSA